MFIAIAVFFFFFFCAALFRKWTKQFTDNTIIKLTDAFKVWRWRWLCCNLFWTVIIVEFTVKMTLKHWKHVKTAEKSLGSLILKKNNHLKPTGPIDPREMFFSFLGNRWDFKCRVLCTHKCVSAVHHRENTDAPLQQLVDHERY